MGNINSIEKLCFFEKFKLKIMNILYNKSTYFDDDVFECFCKN